MIEDRTLLKTLLRELGMVGRATRGVRMLIEYLSGHSWSPLRVLKVPLEHYLQNRKSGAHVSQCGHYGVRSCERGIGIR